MADDSTHSFIRIGGYAGILSGFAILLSGLSTLITGSIVRPEVPSEVAAFMTDVETYGYGFHLYGWFGLVGLLFAIPFTYGIYLAVRESLALSWLGAVAMWAGLVVLFPAYVFTILISTKLTSLFDDLGESAAEPILVVYSSFAGVGTLLFLLGSVLTFSLAPGLLSVAWLRTAQSPRWIGWLGICAGVTGISWVGLVAAPAPLPVLWAVNALINVIWMIAVAATMIRVRKEQWSSNVQRVAGSLAFPTR